MPSCDGKMSFSCDMGGRALFEVLLFQQQSRVTTTSTRRVYELTSPRSGGACVQGLRRRFALWARSAR